MIMTIRYLPVTAVLTVSAFAQSGARPPSVRATAEAVVVAKPDQAKIAVGVITQAPTAQAAASQNASQTQAVLDRLRSAIGNKADIRTISYNVSPNYQYPRDGKPVIVGYNAVNTVGVTIGDLSEVGKVIDVAVQGGANQIQRLEFTLQDEKPARAEALRLATIEARSNAEAMAAALGLKIGAVLSLDQGAAESGRPPVPLMAVRVGAAPTPVEPSPIEIHATVTLTVAVQ
jgi:uncharacterized protein YggE